MLKNYGYETYAMLGFVAALVSYTFSGSVFFFGAFGF